MAVLARLDGVAIRALPPCHWRDGALVDLEAIGAECGRRGALVVDGTHLVGGGGHLDVRRIGAEFGVLDPQWLLGPYGCAFTRRRRSGATRRRSSTTTATAKERHVGACRWRWAAAATRPRSWGRAARQRRAAVVPRAPSAARVARIAHHDLLAEDYRHAAASDRRHRRARRGSAPTCRRTCSPRSSGCDPPPPCPTPPRSSPLTRRSPPVVVSERFGAILSPHLQHRRDVDHLIDGLRDAITYFGHAAAAAPPPAGDFAFTPPG